jgi:site-specific DNA recombinase
MKYLIYLRVSGDEQKESGLGLEAQLASCKEWIEKQTAVGEIVIYTDIVTGTDKKRKELSVRPELMKALNELRANDVIVMAKRDRLSRDGYINSMIERQVEKKKARIVSADGLSDGNESNDVLMRRIVDAFAEHEAMRISERTKAALKAKKARGERIGHIPVSYTHVTLPTSP